MARKVDPTQRPIFSMWAWAVLTPFLVTALGGFDEASSDAEQWQGFGIAVATHLVLGLAFLAAAALERRITGYVAWVAYVALVLLAMSVLRPLVISGLQSIGDVTPVETPFWLRCLLNYVLLSGAVILVGSWLRASDRNARSQERLRAVLRGRAADIRAAEAATDRVVEEFTESVARPVLAALEGARVEPFEASEQAERLRAVAHDVVRPLSHHVFHEAETTDGRTSEPTIAIERVALRRPTMLPERVTPAPAWLPVVALLAVTTVPVFRGYGIAAGSLRMLVAGAIGIGLILLLARIPIRRRWPAIVGAGLGYVVVGVVIAWVFLDPAALWLPPPPAPVPGIYWLYLPIGFTLIAIVLSLGYSLTADARGTERTLERALAFAETGAAESRARYEQTANDLARVLHNVVQGDILATSLQLRMGVVGPSALDELIEGVDRTLHEPSATRAVERTAQDVRDAANAAIVAWSRVMDVTSEAADPECWRWLAHHPAATSLFLDANTEALTNASRHAAAPTADLRLERVPGGVRMLARNPGRLAGHVSDGVGISDLRRRGADVELRQEDANTVLLTIDITDADEQDDELRPV